MAITNKKKADGLITKGDELKKNGMFKQALKKYKNAQELDPERVEIYDKLIATHEEATKEWSEQDMAESVGWVMQKQELRNPAVKLLHERLSPQFDAVSKKITDLILSPTEEDEYRIIEDIKGFGTDAIYPLIFTLLQIKRDAREVKEECPKEE